MDGGEAGSCYEGSKYQPYDNCWTTIDVNMITRYCDQPPQLVPSNDLTSSETSMIADPNSMFIDLTEECTKPETKTNWWGGVEVVGCLESGNAECPPGDLKITKTKIGTVSITEIPDDEVRHTR